MIRAWHFVGKTLRDGSRIPRDGVWLKYTGPLNMCASGLHASREPFDALQYAPGETLCLVDCAGEIIEGNDKLVCSQRRIVARMDATDMLRYFARMQALSLIDKWDDPPDVLLDYLMTGDESLRAAAGLGAVAAALGFPYRGGEADDAARAAVAAWGDAWRAARGAAWGAARRDFNALANECFWWWTR